MSNYKDLFAGIEIPEPLTEEELNQKIIDYKNGQYQEKEEIINHSLRLVFRCLRPFRNTPCDLNDLTSCGVIGLIKSIDAYDIKRGVPFKNFACRCITQEMRNLIQKESNRIMPLSLDYLLEEYMDKNNEYFLRDYSQDIEYNYEEKETYEELIKIVERLPLKKREIVKMYYGFYEKSYSTCQIAEIYDITQQGVHDHLVRANTYLKNQINNKKLCGSDGKILKKQIKK